MEGKVGEDSAFNSDKRAKSRLIDINPISREEMGFLFSCILMQQVSVGDYLQNYLVSWVSP